MKIAGAPISWGVCEVPGWGHQMDPDRVLAEMRGIGLTATEFGPAGWLPEEPKARAAVLAKHGLEAVGSFFLAVMHDPASDPLPAVARELEAFSAAGGTQLILAADSGRNGYDERPELDTLGWETLFKNLDAITAIAAKAGVTASIHPHWGTMVQNDDEVRKVLDNSRVGLCLDTGHMVSGGTDLVDFLRSYADRVTVVHAKDVDTSMSAKLLPGDITWSEGIRAGMFKPIGQGDIDFTAVFDLLREVGFDGYVVLEQDIMIDSEPGPGEGPVHGALASLEAIKKLIG